MAELKPCGTPAAYMRHLRRHEEPCRPCRDANAAQMRAYRTTLTEQPCACCGQPGMIVARGWRMACHRRWLRAGKPAGGPPPARGWLREEYDWLRDGGVSRELAAERVGASRHQVYQWERRRREAVAA